MDGYVKMNAYVPEKDYQMLQRGELVDNNGLRSPKGNYWHDQPILEDISPAEEVTATESSDPLAEQFKSDLEKIAVMAIAAIAMNSVVPSINRFVKEKVYPFAAEKFDAWKNRPKKVAMPPVENEVTDVQEDTVPEDTEKVIYLANHRHSA